MTDLWQVLGYDAVATKVAEILEGGNQIALIEGPPGVGKSWLARDIGDLWEDSGGSTVLVEADFLRSDASYYPFAFAMGPAPSRLRTVGSVVGGLVRAAETLAGTAGLITATVEAIAKARHLRKRERSVFFGDAEQAILHELERLAKNAPMLLIADNLHWWDAMSLWLLGLLGDQRVWDSFTFLSGLRILAVQTVEPYQSVAHPDEHAALLAPGRVVRFDLPHVPRERFQDVLVALGATTRPSPAVTETIFTLSGGHLALARRCAERIASKEEHAFLDASDTDEFVRVLLTKRMQALGLQGREAMALLQTAALLGSTFRRDEICCAASREEHETAKLLRHCRNEGLLEVVDGLDRFVHDIYRQYFLEGSGTERAAICEKLADCLRILRPAEYEIRCLNAVQAECPDEAAALAVHAALQTQREGRAWTDLPPAILAAMDGGGMRPVAERLVTAVRLLRESEFAACLTTLDRLPHRITKSLVAEADWIRAMCLMSTRDEHDRAHGRRILEAWDGFIEEEPEIGVRLMLQLLYGLFHVSDKGPGWALERRIVRSLSARVSFDRAAEDALYVLDRCSSGLHSSDVALVRVRKAVEHFGPTDNQTVIRRPVEFYRCLLNLVAELLENGRFDEACQAASRLAELVGRYPDDIFPRLDLAFSNAIQAELRCGSLSAEGAVARQRELTTRFPRPNDPYFQENALGVYLALAGDLGAALEVFERLDRHLTSAHGEPEPSMVYFLRSNRCAVRLISGDVEAAGGEWPALREIAAANNYMDRDILLRRHDLLAPLFAEQVKMTAREFDSYLLEHEQDRLGPLWRHFGHGFVLPALYIWREN